MGKAVVLRLVRESARKWWWFIELRKMGRVAEAQAKERESVRSCIRTMRTCKIESMYFKGGNIAFERRENVSQQTVYISNVPMAQMAAWVYVYANRMGAQK